MSAHLDEARFAGMGIVVAGAGRAGLSAARYLLSEGARVTVADARFTDPGPGGAGDRPPVATELGDAGARCVGVEALIADTSWTADTSLVVVSPGFAPTNVLVVAAQSAGLPVWGEVELAWRADRAGRLGAPRTWLIVTGTNGKTTTTSMLEEIVAADGRSVAACGNIGLPVLDAMARTPRVDVLCVEMSSFQLHWAPSVAPTAGVVLNIAEDHLDWHGGFDPYAQAKALALRGDVGVVGLDDAVASTLPVGARTRRVGFTSGVPSEGELGVEDGVLTDRAFGAGALLPAGEIHPRGPSGLADALAASALALAAGVDGAAVARGLRGFRPAAHRGEVVAVLDGVEFVDDSKATNPHAAHAALSGRTRTVLIAGGLLKGASVDQLIIDAADRLAGVVVIGTDRGIVVDAIARHAPEVPTVTVFTGDDGAVNVTRFADQPSVEMDGSPARRDGSERVMDEAVARAWELVRSDRAAGRAPDSVLLAPAAASLDMFASYGARGDAFAAAASRLPGAVPSTSGGDSR